MRSITEQLTSRVVNEIITEAKYEATGRPELDANVAGYASPPQDTNPPTNPFPNYVPGGPGGGAVPISPGGPEPPIQYDEDGYVIPPPVDDIRNVFPHGGGFYGNQLQPRLPIYHPGRYMPDWLQDLIPENNPAKPITIQDILGNTDRRRKYRK
mgnify:CR=1 FL=1|jgi:hypothetical protein